MCVCVCGGVVFSSLNKCTFYVWQSTAFTQTQGALDLYKTNFTLIIKFVFEEEPEEGYFMPLKIGTDKTKTEEDRCK